MLAALLGAMASRHEAMALQRVTTFMVEALVAHYIFIFYICYHILSIYLLFYKILSYNTKYSILGIIMNN